MGSGQNEVAILTYTVKQLSSALGVCSTALYSAIAKNEIPHLKIGNRILISRAVVEQMLSADTLGANSTASRSQISRSK